LIQGNNGSVADAYAVHLWNEMWRRYKWDKDARYSVECLVERLKRRFLEAEP